MNTAREEVTVTFSWGIRKFSWGIRKALSNQEATRNSIGEYVRTQAYANGIDSLW